jgi:hypothetical protein
MAIYRLLQNAAFEPSEIETLVQAFESICRGLKFGQKDQALRDAVARKILEYADLGERDPERIYDCVLGDLQGTVPRDIKNRPGGHSHRAKVPVSRGIARASPPAFSLPQSDQLRKRGIVATKSARQRRDQA